MWRISAASWMAARGKTAARPPARSRRWSRTTSNCRRTARSARKLGNRVVSALTANPRFISAAIPLQIFPPLFNRYRRGRASFRHSRRNAVRGDRLTGLRIRTDLSVTLFLSEPDEYDGGELVVEDNYGSHEIKLPAGDLVVYPASSLHMVTPVTRGFRVASFFWLQSMIRDAHARSLIFDLDIAIQSLVARLGRDDPETVKLTRRLSQSDSQLGRSMTMAPAAFASVAGIVALHMIPAGYCQNR